MRRFSPRSCERSHFAANGSLEDGQEVSVVLVGDAADLMIGDNARHVEGVGVPPMRELLSKLGTSVLDLNTLSIRRPVPLGWGGVGG